jgi:hypothetical protein
MADVERRTFPAGIYKCDVEKVAGTFSMFVRNPGGHVVAIGTGATVNAAAQRAADNTRDEGAKKALNQTRFPEF